MSALPEPFADKLALVLKVLSMSRARLAADLGVDKSVVARWVSGAAKPSAHNLAQLSALMARKVPGFTALDWDRNLVSLASLFGAETPPARSNPGAPGLRLPLMDQIASTTALRASTYEGFWRSTRPYAPSPGRYIHDQCLVRLGDDGLLALKMVTGGVPVEGLVLPLHNQLFIIASQLTSAGLVFAILHGVHGVNVEVLDGLTLSTSLDVGRTPIASALVLHRTGGLTDDPAADDARLAAIGAPDPLAPEGSIPEDLRRHLERDVGPEQGSCVDWILRMPISLSIARGPLMAG